MSKIIKKRDLDLVIESTLKEVGLTMEDDHVCETCGNEPCTCEEDHDDIVEMSVKDLAESVSNSVDLGFLKEDMDSFNKLINYRNK